MPPLLNLHNENAYRIYFNQHLANSNGVTCHGVRVFINSSIFKHAFFGSTRRDRIKDVFSRNRAERMGWIIPTIKDPNAEWYQGYLKKYDVYAPTRSVSVAYENFVVILKYKMSPAGLSAEFVTCYVANKYSMRKIRTSPLWNIDDCRIALERFGR